MINLQNLVYVLAGTQNLATQLRQLRPLLTDAVASIDKIANRLRTVVMVR